MVAVTQHSTGTHSQCGRHSAGLTQTTHLALPADDPDCMARSCNHSYTGLTQPHTHIEGKRIVLANRRHACTDAARTQLPSSGRAESAGRRAEPTHHQDTIHMCGVRARGLRAAAVRKRKTLSLVRHTLTRGTHLSIVTVRQSGRRTCGEWRHTHAAHSSRARRCPVELSRGPPPPPTQRAPARARHRLLRK